MNKEKHEVRDMIKPPQWKKAGFSIIELMIAMAVSLLVSLVIFTIYESQTRAQLTQELYTELQEGLRAAMVLLEREIRTAGADPEGTADAEIITAEADELRFTRDVDGPDDIYDGEVDVVNFPHEDIRYARRQRGGVWMLGRETGGDEDDDELVSLMDHIEALDFVYLETDPADPENMLPMGRPVVGDDIDRIRAIEVTIVARSDREDGGWFIRRFTDDRDYLNQQGDVILADGGPNPNFRRLRLSSTIICRNLLNN